MRNGFSAGFFRTVCGAVRGKSRRRAGIAHRAVKNPGYHRASLAASWLCGRACAASGRLLSGSSSFCLSPSSLRRQARLAPWRAVQSLCRPWAVRVPSMAVRNDTDIRRTTILPDRAQALYYIGKSVSVSPGGVPLHTIINYAVGVMRVKLRTFLCTY